MPRGLRFTTSHPGADGDVATLGMTLVELARASGHTPSGVSARLRSDSGSPHKYVSTQSAAMMQALLEPEAQVPDRLFDTFLGEVERLSRAEPLHADRFVNQGAKTG